ncbi:MAG TPA: farnesyl diphosphate synthase [Gemmatimonadales bacterium]|jgi:geranylgeranyl pyrophosphate synthase|nr:farnesyl diphosphate synthase [Gemmatimonadales bacterium]
MAEAEPGTSSATDLLLEARESIDSLLGDWAERLGVEVGGRHGQALAYALKTPGKRVRAALVLGAYRSVGGESPGIAGMAAAVETVHTYSLVHDDLPCMDDDDLRRGRPTTHRAFDVYSATLAGYLLVPVAARLLSVAAAELELSTASLGRMACELFRAGGIEGMVGGQWLDLAAEGKALSLAELTEIHRGKTGALIRAACIIGGMAAQAGPAELAALTSFGEDIGVAFQIADDVLDATGTSQELGKTAGRDAQLKKSTYVALCGIDGARREAERLAHRAVAQLEAGGVHSGALGALAGYIVNRTS